MSYDNELTPIDSVVQSARKALLDRYHNSGKRPQAKKCSNCNITIISRYDPLKGEWYYDNYDINTNLCITCNRKANAFLYIENRLTEAGIPFACLSMNLDNIETHPGNRSNLIIVQNYIRSLPWKQGLFFYGPCGTGKTHLAVAISRKLLLNLRTVKFTSAQNMYLKIRETYKQTNHISEYAMLGKYINPQYLILDDLGVEKVTEWTRQILDYVVYERDIQEKPIITTSNLSLDQIGKQIDPRISSRLLHRSHVLIFTGNDYRKRKI